MLYKNWLVLTLRWRSAFAQDRSFNRFLMIMVGLLATRGRGTLTAGCGSTRRTAGTTSDGRRWPAHHGRMVSPASKLSSLTLRVEFLKWDKFPACQVGQKGIEFPLCDGSPERKEARHFKNAGLFLCQEH